MNAEGGDAPDGEGFLDAVGLDKAVCFEVLAEGLQDFCRLVEAVCQGLGGGLSGR